MLDNDWYDNQEQIQSKFTIFNHANNEVNVKKCGFYFVSASMFYVTNI